MAEKVVQPKEETLPERVVNGDGAAAVAIDARPAVDAPTDVQPSTVRRLTLGLVDGLWNLLRRPALLLVVGGLLAVLLAAARMTPQMPGQLLDSPAEATRWINSVPANWGGIGGWLARSLHLYDLFRAPWFGVLVAATALLAAVQLADAIGLLQQWRRLPTWLQQSVDDAHTTAGATVARARFAIDTAVPESTEQIAAVLRESWASLVPLAVPSLEVVATNTPVPDSLNTESLNSESPNSESLNTDSLNTDSLNSGSRGVTTLLARRNGWNAWVRILLPAALLVGALLVWVNMIWSWSVIGSALAPGASLVVDSRDLVISNPVVQPEDAASVLASIGEQEVHVPTDGSTVRAHGLSLSATRYSPAIVVSAEEAILAMPGAPQPQTDLAVTFPVAGAEQYVVLPGAGIGIRLVRVADDESTFLAEVYDEETVQPISSEQIEGRGELEVPLGEETITLSLAPSWSVNVTAGRGYASWAWLPLLLLALAGALALLRPASFLCAQLAPWEATRTVVTLQGSAKNDVLQLRERVSSNPLSVTSD